MDDSSSAKARQDLRSLGTPGGYILIWAFNYVSFGLEVIEKNSPQISEWANGRMLGNLLQVGTILAALLRIERALGLRDYSVFHSGLVKEIAPSVREIYLPSLQDLSCFLLRADRSLLGREQIPALSGLFTEDEAKVANCIGLWLVLTLKGIRSLSDRPDFQVAAGLANIVDTWAQLIAEHVLSDHQLTVAIG